MSEVETVKLEAEVDLTELSGKTRESEMSLDDILSADSEGSKLNLDGFSDGIGRQQKVVSGYGLSYHELWL